MIAWIERLLRKHADLTNLTKLHNINKNAKKITEKLPILNRTEKMQETRGVYNNK